MSASIQEKTYNNDDVFKPEYIRTLREVQNYLWVAIICGLNPFFDFYLENKKPLEGADIKLMIVTINKILKEKNNVQSIEAQLVNDMRNRQQLPENKELSDEDFRILEGFNTHLINLLDPTEDD